MSSKLKYCKKCLFPETKPDIYFDSEGVCDACRSAERKHGLENAINWDERAKSFDKIISNAKSKAQGWYDCVIPVSGGKDSTWQVYALKKIHNMNPLAITFDQFDQTEIGRHNLKIMADIGVDHIHFTLNPNVVKKLVKKGFEIIGDPYWVNHLGMFTVPFHIATKFNIPLVIFGENPQFEYGGPESGRDNMIMDRRWRQEFGGMRGFREEDMVDNDISLGDLRILHYPSDNEVKNTGVMGTFYGQYFKWDALIQTKLIKDFGWLPLKAPPKGSWMDYENCDMQFVDIRERIKYLKYGYGRATDQLSIEIRNNRISRHDALEIVKKIDGNVDEKSILDFCQFIGITRNEYDHIMESFVNYEIFKKDGNNKIVPIECRQ
jgi:N-acetyl sugar amidotransferase